MDGGERRQCRRRGQVSVQRRTMLAPSILVAVIMLLRKGAHGRAGGGDGGVVMFCTPTCFYRFTTAFSGGQCFVHIRAISDGQSLFPTSGGGGATKPANTS